MAIYLASNSPRRKELLKYLVDDFKVIVPSTDEYIHENLKIDAQIAANAFQKASKAADMLKINGEGKKGDIIIAADTIVCLNEVLLKPKDEDEARLMLKKLSGNWHKVISGLSVIVYDTYIKYSVFTVSDVKFRALTDEEIDYYVQTGEPMDKAGAYAIQGIGARYIEEIRGDYYSIMGLPLCKLDKILREISREYA